jgi:hypothetical protein
LEKTLTTADLANSLPLATDLSTGAVSASAILTQSSTISLLAAISSGQVSLNQPGTSAPIGTPVNYASN